MQASHTSLYILYTKNSSTNRNSTLNKKASIRWQDSAPPISGYLANQWAERRLVTHS